MVVQLDRTNLMSTLTKVARLRAWWTTKCSQTKLFEPALSPIILAALTLVLLIPVSRTVISNNLPLTVNSSDDIRAYMSMRLVEPKDQRRAVFNLGGSSLLRAVEEGPALERQFNDRFQFYNLTTPSQTNIESLLLLNKIDLRAGDLVVMHVNISRLNTLRPLKHWICTPYFYTINPDDITAIMTEIGITPEVNPLCHVTWLSRHRLLKKMLKNLLHRDRPPKYLGIYPLPLDRDPEALKKMREDRLAKQADPAFEDSWLTLNMANARANIGLIKQMYEYAQQRGAQFVLLDLPMNRDWFIRYHGQWFPFEPDYQAQFKGLKTAGIDYRDLRYLPGYTFDDFYDQTHMTQQARRKFLPDYKSIVLEKLAGTTR